MVITFSLPIVDTIVHKLANTYSLSQKIPPEVI